ncbi:WecB/TagA/CpsF family glycosyltransferase [Methylotenera mobilis]|uniref:Glycosyl transferase, WecB/TagA/CpsF family n=1 Tax=Methylotenera mobilis (strain JLW8 / ATCC BAA-1282 / DSM 17540) TaxID=583345 RepID=C6WXP3_METML|nr:WecB/TagA/CpsF family glycosyltransferase [Methylotenera mobilis]ACT48692.1 glycosyl transferase, WecB/TagA/CpsF family [Methylotenera mobilis JLW8]
MRVLHVVRQFHPAIGGLENFVYCLVLEQLRTGIDAEVLTLDSVFHQRPFVRLPYEELVGPIKVRRINWSGSYKYPFAPTVLNHLKGYDIVHVHAVDFFIDFLSITRLLHGSRLVLSTHGGFFHTQYASTLKKIFFNTITRFSLRNYSQVYACSNGDYQSFEPICKGKLRLIENGVDVNKFFDASAKQATRKFVFIGRFSDNKRIDLLVSVFSELIKLHLDYKLLIIGKDWDNNQARLIQQIHSLGLGSNVAIHNGLDDASIKAMFAEVSFIISASEYEGFGMTLVEGMSAGLIPIASPIISFKNIISQSGLGLLADFTEPHVAAQTIHAYTEFCQLNYTSLREQAKVASQSYGWVGTAERFQAAYDELLGDSYRMLQGVRFDTRDSSEVFKAFDASITQEHFLRVAIANAHTLNLARNDSQYLKVLGDTLVLNDGIGVNIASQWKYGRGFAENLNGTDLIPKYLAQSQTKLRIFLLGATDQVVSACFQRCKTLFPQHEWVGFYNGYIDANEHIAVCERIHESGANLLLVAMGNPLQEKWIHQYGETTGAKLCIGVGALFDFMAGSVTRAPSWVRRIHCEWIYRLAIEPKRMWRRYMVGNFLFLIAAWRNCSR